MKTPNRSLALAMLITAGIAACTLKAQAPRVPPCPAGSVLLTAAPVFDVGNVTIAKACPAFTRAIDDWYAKNTAAVAGWTPAQLIAALTRGELPTVPVPTPPPPVITPSPAPEQPSVAPFLVEDFSTYAGVEQLRASSRYAPSETQITNRYARIVIDSSVGHGGSKKSARFDYLDATSEGGTGTTGRCTNSGHGVMAGLWPPPSAKRMWVEIFVRFSSNFSFAGSPDWRCTSGAEMKLFIFGVTGPSSSRFDLQLMDGNWTFGYPDNETAYVSGAAPRPRSMFDGQWHRIRFALGVSSTIGARDGMARLWVDDALRADYQNIIVNRGGLGPFYLGSTRNQGAAADMSMWIGRVSVWTSNPGWQ